MNARSMLGHGTKIRDRAANLVLVASVLAAAGCAGSRPAPPPAAEPHLVKVDASNVVAVQQAGYKLVNKDGRQLYCRTDTITGSRLRTQTTCLTEQELQEQMSANQQAMSRMTSSQTASKSGH